jgi:hypothetical protein
MADFQEAKITINGTELTKAQAMTLRVALLSFLSDLEGGLGDDEHGRFMTKAYRETGSAIARLMVPE